MKVLIIHCTYQYTGGEDTVVAEEINLLKANGVDVELLEFSNQGNSFLKILQLPFNISSYHKTIERIKAYSPDIVHIHNLHYAASPSVMFAIRKLRIPFVITLHNYRLLCPSGILFFDGKPFLDSLNQSFPWTSIRKGVYRNSRLLTFWVALATQVNKWAGTWNWPDRYIVLSRHAKSIFLGSNLNLPECQIEIKPNFTSSPVTAGLARGNHFLYVGRLSEEKGIQLLLNVFSVSGYPLKIAGDGPMRNEVIHYSSRYSNIEFLDRLNKEEVFKLMQGSTALIFPSIWYEGMPLTIIEAFVSGTPVIASNLGAMETMITDGFNGLHFEAGNEADFLAKIKTWNCLSGEEKVMYGKNAKTSYMQCYSPEKNVAEILSIYSSVLGEHERKHKQNKDFKWSPNHS
jgi:glycosyltransferase involved in cell wall biosynthesis